MSRAASVVDYGFLPAGVPPSAVSLSSLLFVAVFELHLKISVPSVLRIEKGNE
jgi:hypothetical protein